MRTKNIQAALSVVSCVCVGMGKARWQNAARAACMKLKDQCAELAEALGCDLKISLDVKDLIITIKALRTQTAEQLLKAVLASDLELCEQDLIRLEAELIQEQSDYDLQAARGFSEHLLGIQNSKSLPDAKQMKQYLAEFKSCFKNICASVGGEHSELKDAQNGCMQLVFKSAQNDLDGLLKLENPGFCPSDYRIAKSPFMQHQQASCSQSFMYFGCVLGKLDLAARASAAIASTAIGAGFNSRVTEIIRVQLGLAYSAFARIAFIDDLAYWHGLMQTHTDNEERAISELKNIFSKLSLGLSEAEFSAAKEYLINSNAMQNRDFASVHNLMLNRMRAGLDEDFNERLNEQITRCGLDEVNKFLTNYKHELSFYIVSNHE